jgi:hypothetical protein
MAAQDIACELLGIVPISEHSPWIQVSIVASVVQKSTIVQPQAHISISAKVHTGEDTDQVR